MKELKKQIKELQSLRDDLIQVGNSIAWSFPETVRSIKGIDYDHKTKKTFILGYEITPDIFFGKGWAVNKEAVLKFTGGYSKELIYHFTSDGEVNHIAYKEEIVEDQNTGEEVLKEIVDVSKCWDSALSDNDLGLKILNDILEDIC